MIKEDRNVMGGKERSGNGGENVVDGVEKDNEKREIGKSEGRSED